MFYSLAHLELIDLLAAAEELLALTGDAVELCPNYGETAAGSSAATASLRAQEVGAWPG